MSDGFGHLLRAHRKDHKMGTNPITPEWPTSRDGDLAVLIVQSASNVQFVGSGGATMIEVKPAWYWRLWHALTPWRVRTRVFVGGGSNAVRGKP